MISETDLMWWCCLDSCRALKEIKSVCDLGLQGLVYNVWETYQETTKTFVELCGEPHVDLADCRSSADMWRRLKREVVTLDVVGEEMSLVLFDLNNDQVSPALKEHFDFVTNIGTTEHVFNQANCFKVLHDLTDVGGIMAHAVPFAGLENHGLFKYSMKFFTALAKENDYDCLDAWVSWNIKNQQFKPGVGEFFVDSVGMFRDARSSRHHPIDHYHLNYADYRATDSCIYVFLRKTSSKEFRIPWDLPDDYKTAG
jgi:hypothetical protein